MAVLLDAPVRVRGGNRNLTWKGAVHTESGDHTEVFIKALPPEGLLAEVLCAILGREVGLSIPSPYLVKDPEGFLSEPEAGGHTVLFGSGVLGFPSFGHYFHSQIPDFDTRIHEVLKRLMAWKNFHVAIVFDEWIANDDRHLANLLYGEDDFVLIDHERAFGGLGWPEKELDANVCTENQLAEWLRLCGDVAVKTFDRAVPKVMGDFASCSLDAAWDEAQSDRYRATQWRQMVLEFLHERLPGLENMLRGLVRGQTWIL